MITGAEFTEAVTATALHLEANPGDALSILLAHDQEDMKGIFKRRYTLVGRDWVKRLDAEDLQAFIKMGMDAMEHGRMGGIARSKNAKRDDKGRFVKNGGQDGKETS